MNDAFSSSHSSPTPHNHDAPENLPATEVAVESGAGEVQVLADGLTTAPATEVAAMEPSAAKSAVADSSNSRISPQALADNQNNVATQSAQADFAAEGSVAATSVAGNIDRELTPEEMQVIHAQWEEMWADGENANTRWGRALFAILAGGFLAWTQYKAPIDTGQEWNRWIWISVVCNFLLPAGIVWFFFAQGLRSHNWLSDQRLNAWNYGWNWRHLSRQFKIALLMFLPMLPILWFASRDPSAQGFYRSYFPLVDSPQKWLWLLGTLTIYMACWEWFFRGFLLFGIAQATGPIAAILLQAAMFGASHAGKPPLEMLSSFAGGAILGAVCWREKTFVPAFLTHALIHIAWAILVLN